MPNNHTLSSTAHQQSHSSILLNNQNLLHVKFHVNKIQENLLSKRLKQLNEQEMKIRLKNQRTSNDLVNFLNDCKQSTGYLSKMKPPINKTISSTLASLEQKRLDFSQRKISKIYSDLESNTSSSLDLNCCYENDDTNLTTSTYATTSKSKNGLITRPRLNRNFCFKSLDFDKNSITPQIDNELIRMITPLKSLPETVTENVTDSQSDETPSKIPSLFEQILSRSETNSSTPTSTQFSCSNSSPNNSSKASASSRSNCSTCSSHDDSKVTSSLKRQDSFRKLRPASCSTAKLKSKQSKSKLSDSTTLSNIDWLTSTFTFDLDLNKNANDSSMNNSNIKTNELFNKRTPSAKSNEKKKIKQKSFKNSEFKSRSLNLLLNSIDFTAESFNKTSSTSSSIRASIDMNPEVSLNSFYSTDTTQTKQSNRSSESRYFCRKSLQLKHPQAFPIQINMSRNLIRKKQLGLINDYKNLNSMEFIKSLRQIQQNLDNKVKQFSHNSNITNTNNANTTIQQLV